MAELNISQRGRRKRAAARVDLTAMVDLAFLLVTFFMLTTTLSRPRIIKLSMPVGEATDAVPESCSLTLCLGSHNKVFLYRGMLDHPLSPPKVIELDKNGLRTSLMNIKQQVQQSLGRSLVVLVKPAAHSNYGNLVNTIDELNITQNSIYAIEPITGKEMDELKVRHMD